MAKAGDDIKELQRSLRRLVELDGRPLWLAEGLFLLWPSHVVDPEPLLGPLTLAGVKAGLHMSHPPLEVSPHWLGKVQRDLRRLSLSGWALEVWEAHRALAKFPRPDRGWLEGRQARLAGLPTERPETPGGPFELVGWLRGPNALEAVREMAVEASPTRGWRKARERVERLAVCLRTDRPPDDDPPLQAAWQRLRRLTSQPAPRRILLTLTRLLGVEFPSGPLNRPSGSRWDLPDYVRRQGLALLEELRRNPSLPSEDRRQQVAGWALLFEPEPGPEPGRLPLEQARVLAGRRLTTSQAGALLGLGVTPETLLRLADHVEAGLKTDWLARLKPYQLGEVSVLQRLGEQRVDPRRTEVWCAWMARLGPHFPTMGREFDIPNHLVERWSTELLLLSHCLNSLPSPQQVSAVDSVLGIFGSSSQYAQGLLEGLDGTSPGLGLRLYPEFQAWLGEDALLDRHLHLRTMAGLEPALSQSLLEDFREPRRLEAEADWLAVLERPSPAQTARLEGLRSRRSSAGPEATRRRLLRQNEGLLAQAVQLRIDEVARAVLHNVTGQAPAGLTPALRDAVRLFLSSERNHHLGRLVLDFAVRQPGQPIERALPANQAWLAEAARRFPVEEWLAPRTQALRGWSMGLEEDPLEVLRMGVPFGTCLSLTDGSNAAATWLNALDANKRVLYVRDEAGRIRARKLLAIGRDWSLLGYHLYQVEPDPLVEQAVDRFCDALGTALGLPLTARGKPARLHEGKWYDDGPVAFSRQESPVEPYCQSLGRPVPRRVPLKLSYEARAWAAWRDGRVEDLLALRDHLHDSPALRCEWARQLPDAWRLAPELLTVTEAHRRLGADRTWWERVGRDWHTLWPSAELAEFVAQALVEGSDEPDDLAWSLDEDLRLTPIARALALVDRVEGWVKEEMHFRYLSALKATYGRAPDPVGVLRCLTGSRRSLLARRGALAILAAYPFPPDPRDGQEPWSPLQTERWRPVGCRPALTAVRQAARRFPRLAADPVLQAALLRQAEPQLPVKQVLARLPRVERAPFEALADLQLHPRPGLVEWLAEWAQPARTVEDWRPGEWELHYHRRHPDLPWRRLLRSAAERGNERAKDRLSALGDDSVPLAGARAEDCQRVRRQVAGKDPATAPSRANETAEADIGTLYAALALVEERPEALGLLLASPLPEGWPTALLLRFAGDARVEQEPLLGKLLTHRRWGESDGWRSEVLIRLWQKAELRPLLRLQLGPAWHEHYDCWPIYRSLLAAATRLGLEPIPLEAVMAAREGTVLRRQESFAAFAETLQLVLSATSPSRWVEEFLDLQDAWSVSQFLNALPQGNEEFFRLLRQHPRLGDGLHRCWLPAGSNRPPANATE